MKHLFKTIPLIIIFLGIAGMAACNDKEVDTEVADRDRLVKMEADIDDFIGEAECEGYGDCRAIAFGSKPCGGPWSYKVFSASATDTVQMLAMVDDYNKFNKTLNERHGWMSDCMMVLPPKIGCVDGHCVAILPEKSETIE